MSDLALGGTRFTGGVAFGWRGVVLAMIAASFALHLAAPLPADTSWLITVCERMLAGQTLYRDIAELNPPMSVWFYLPWVALGQWIGVAPSVLVVCLTIACGVFATALSARILAAGRLLPGLPAWWIVLTFALVVAPTQTFSQREHFAVMLVLPMLVAIAVRATGAAPGILEKVLAGLAAGLTMTLKPHFALAILLPLLLVAIGRRSLRPIFAPECFVAGLVLAVYAAVVVILQPVYFNEMLPLAGAIYVPNRMALGDLLVRPFVLMSALTIAAVLLRDGLPRAPLAKVLAAAMAGFLIAYLAQGKGWAYHVLPLYTLALIALGLSLAAKMPARPKAVEKRAQIAHAALVLTLTATAVAPFSEIAPRLYVERVLAGMIEGRGTSIALLDDDLEIGQLHGVSGGTLVNRGPALWLAGNAYDLCWRETSESQLALCRDAIALERKNLREDLTRRPPDVVIASYRLDDWLDWARQDPETAAILDRYRVIGDHAGPFYKFRVLARDSQP